MRLVPNLDTFSTERLTAERLRPEHLAEYQRLFQDDQVMATLSPDGQPLSDEEVERWLGFSVDHWDCNGFGFWAFRDKVDQRFVGRAGLKRSKIDGEHEVELAYALLPEFWVGGWPPKCLGPCCV